jgi:hypothetical protein
LVVDVAVVEVGGGEDEFTRDDDGGGLGAGEIIGGNGHDGDFRFSILDWRAGVGVALDRK